MVLRKWDHRDWSVRAELKKEAHAKSRKCEKWDNLNVVYAQLRRREIRMITYDPLHTILEIRRTEIDQQAKRQVHQA